MKIGMVGMGKLGFPVALAIESKGHEVKGFDITSTPHSILLSRIFPHQEIGVPELLNGTNITMQSVDHLVNWADIIFCAVQTPHEEAYEGCTRVPEERIDFDYTHLTAAVANIADAARIYHKQTTLVVISTCLPGTFHREIEPLLNEYIDYVYNPFFIAMGTVIPDFLDPEFVLLGGKGELLEEFYATLHKKPLFHTDITTAEGIKVFYNTFITMKTVLANTYGEMAYRLGMNVDDIYEALSLATDRIVSPKYMRAGMGDGGGCHPRDNIALSYIANKVGMSHNIFDDLMQAREDHAEFLADLIESNMCELPVYILGRAFKPETRIETGSPAILLANILKERMVVFEHEEDFSDEIYDDPGLFFLGTQHDRYKDIRFAPGSVVIDPFGYIDSQDGVKVIRIGRP